MQRVLILCTLLAAVAVAIPVHKNLKVALRRIPEEDIKDDPWSGIDKDDEDDVDFLLEAGEPSLIPGEIPPYHANNPVQPSKPQINFLSGDYDDADIEDYEPWHGPDFDPDDFPIYSSSRIRLPGEPEEPSLIPGELEPYHQNPQTKPRIRGDQEIVDDEDDDDFEFEDEDNDEAIF